jgi:starch-binding outer membrane protein, SusD/RagB family
MRTFGIVFMLTATLFLLYYSCSEKWLDINPYGNLDENVLANEKGINSILIGAYSKLDGISESFGWEASSSNWLYGDIRGMIANKGAETSDQPDINPFQTFSETADNPYLLVKWRSVYESVSRCNSALVVTLKAIEIKTITKDQADLFIRQARALRGWYHFEAWRMWEKIPWVDENAIPNMEDNKEDIRVKIISDLQEGTKLPDNMGLIGRFNGTVSKVLLAKALMQMNHDYKSALPLLQDVKEHGTRPNGQPVGLARTYGEIFDTENRNGIEAIYTVQYSVSDGSGGWNSGWGEILNYPYKFNTPGYGCCGFFQPTQEYVNSFRTDASGLPMLDNNFDQPANVDLRDQGIPGGGIWNPTKNYTTVPYYNACTVYDPARPYSDLGYETLVNNNKGKNPLTSPSVWRLRWTEDNSKPVDPRLDWTVGRRGIPYWDWGVHTGADWIRDQTYGGPYSPKKHVYKKSQIQSYTEAKMEIGEGEDNRGPGGACGWGAYGFSSNGYRMIRFADVLLLLAECQIETGDLAGALANINAVRARAANPDGFVKEADGLTPAANYKIGLYPSFPDADYARKALRMERKLELGMEGHRWFDLNRWGITVPELNRVLAYEKTTPWGNNMYGSATVGSEDVTYPVPQRQIDLSNGRLVQNR